MKFLWRLSLLLLPFCCLAAEDVSPIFELQGGLGVGQASYEETGINRPLHSDWTADQFSLYVDFSWTSSVLAVRGGVVLTQSGEDTETWTVDGAVAQRNRMQVDGITAEITVATADAGTDRFFLTPVLGVRIGDRSFERSGFVLAGNQQSSFLGPVTEDVRTLSALAGLEGVLRFHDRWTWVWGAEVAWIVSNEADNSGFNAQVDGGGGWGVSLDTALLWDLPRPGHHLGLRLQADWEQLDGGIHETLPVEWPDNEWTEWTVGLVYAVEW